MRDEPLKDDRSPRWPGRRAVEWSLVPERAAALPAPFLILNPWLSVIGGTLLFSATVYHVIRPRCAWFKNPVNDLSFNGSLLPIP
jgi:hypothetical protein